MINILFVCSENRLRSPTDEAVFSEYPNVNAISAGTNKDSETAVSGDLIEWADVILVMEKIYKKKISSAYQSLLKDKKLAVLSIQDNYEFMDEGLVRILKNKVPRYVAL